MPNYKRTTAFLIIALVIAVTVILSLLGRFDIMTSVGDIWIWVAAILLGYASNLLTKPRSPKEVGTAKSEDHPDMVLNDRAIAQLTNLARLQFRDTLKLSLRLIGEELEAGRIPPHFRLWEETEAELKKGLVTSKPEYDALEDFTKALNQCPDRGKPDFDVMSNLCKNHYERLKRLGLAS